MSVLAKIQSAASSPAHSRQGGGRSSQRGRRCAGTRSKPRLLKIRGLNELLREFGPLLAPPRPKPLLLEQHQRVLRQFEDIHHVWEERQISVAEGFNVLRTMRLTRKELCHSNILAWLLDHRLDQFGTHAQGNIGFRLFLEKLGLPEEFGDADYRVGREVHGEGCRLDVVIEADGVFVIGIENKVDSAEILRATDGTAQTLLEWAALTRRGKNLGVPALEIKAFFLTRDNKPPRSKNFKQISWRLVADVFEAFSAKAKPAMVKLFAQHYAETLRLDVVSETETQEEEDE